MATLDYYADQATHTLSGNWIKFDCGFTASSWIIANDNNTLRLEASFNGGDIHSKILKNESVSFDDRRRKSIWLRVQGGLSSGIDYRVQAWERA